MPYPGQKTIRGWGVVREKPWHLVGIYQTEREALIKRGEMGTGYVAAFGEGREGADDFIWTQPNS